MLFEVEAIINNVPLTYIYQILSKRVYRRGELINVGTATNYKLLV